MLKLREFVLPIKGLANEKYGWNFQLKSDFFAAFEHSPIDQAAVDVIVELDRRPSLLIFDFHVGGFINCSCDRCTADIRLPLNRSFRLMVKLAWEDEAGDNDPEIIFIDPDTSEFDLAVYLYEFACLSIPLSKTYECEEEINPPCNSKILEKLEGDNSESEEKDDESENIWDQIKNELN
jgi:uncharacterized protein